MGEYLNAIFDKNDLQDEKYAPAVSFLCSVDKMLKEKNLPSHPDLEISFFRRWEYSRALLNAPPKGKVLDAGGSGSIFSVALAMKGAEVYSTDINKERVKNSNKAAKKIGVNLKAVYDDISQSRFKDKYFDSVYCISVIEHLPREKQEQAVSEMARVLKDNGLFVLTFDYGLNGCNNPVENKKRLQELVDASGLNVCGNKNFDAFAKDLGGRFTDYTFGFVLLKKGKAVGSAEPEHSLKDWAWFFVRDWKGLLKSSFVYQLGKKIYRGALNK